jgi:hypothetical protein
VSLRWSAVPAAIGAFIDHWNDHPHPFAWTKDADEILAETPRAKTKQAASDITSYQARVQTTWSLLGRLKHA